MSRVYKRYWCRKDKDVRVKVLGCKHDLRTLVISYLGNGHQTEMNSIKFLDKFYHIATALTLITEGSTWVNKKTDKTVTVDKVLKNALEIKVDNKFMRIGTFLNRFNKVKD